MINLLEYNKTTTSSIRKPTRQEMSAFKKRLEAAGLAVTMRVSHGGNIKAACGQLANHYNNKKLQEENYENYYNQPRVRQRRT